MRRRCVGLVALLLGLWGSAALAQESDVEIRKLQEILSESQSRYETVRDYQCLFFKQEKEGEGLGAKEKIFLKFEKPFKIFMKWLEPSRKKGVQVFYERGRFDNKLVIHKPGLLLGLMPIVFLDQNSPYVREGSAAYNIEDAGIGTFLADLAKDVASAQKAGTLKVSFPETAPDAGQMAQITLGGTDKKSTGFMARQVKVLFDRESKLPIGMELINWQDQTTGIYSYENLKLNLGQNDSSFQKEAHRRIYKFFFHIES